MRKEFLNSHNILKRTSIHCCERHKYEANVFPAYRETELIIVRSTVREEPSKEHHQ